MIMNSWMSMGLSACAPPLMMFIIGTGSSVRHWRRRGSGRAAAPRASAAALATASDTPRMALAPSRLLLGVPSSVDQRVVDAALILGVHAGQRIEDLAVDGVDGLAHALAAGSAACRRRGARWPRARRWRRPDGTAARPSAPSSRTTSTSTVGLPRLSRISRPIMSMMAVMTGSQLEHQVCSRRPACEKLPGGF